MAVTFERVNNGFRVSRTFGSLSAASAGAMALEDVQEKAYAPQPFPAHVTAGQAYNPASQRDEE